jgi:hypothetical protein
MPARGAHRRGGVLEPTDLVERARAHGPIPAASDRPAPSRAAPYLMYDSSRALG